MPRKKVTENASYTVICGCDADEVRYEIGDPYSPSDHEPATTEALLEMNCLEENDGDR